MALCKYCGKAEIGWYQTAGGWVACEVQRDSAGNVVTKAQRNGTRTVNRPVADPARPHYPHGKLVNTMGTECPDWTPSAAAASARGKGRRGWKRATTGAPLPGTIPELPPVLLGAPRLGALPFDPTGMTEAQTMDALKAMLSGAAAKGAIAGAAIAGIPLPTASASLTPPAPPVVSKPTVPLPSLSREALASWARAEAAIVCDLLPGTRTLLWGPPGTGKTELPYLIALARKWAHFYQLMTEETPGSDLLGHLIVQAGSTVWSDGTLGKALRASQDGPVVLVIDEIGRASADALSACLTAATNPESLRLTLRTGEVLLPKVENWHVVATSNDEPGMLPAAIQDRFHVDVCLTAPAPGLVDSFTTLEARRLAVSESREYSIRALLTYDRLVAKGMNMRAAASLVWEPARAKSFLDAAKVEGLAGAR